MAAEDAATSDAEPELEHPDDPLVEEARRELGRRAREVEERAKEVARLRADLMLLRAELNDAEASVERDRTAVREQSRAIHEERASLDARWHELAQLAEKLEAQLEWAAVTSAELDEKTTRLTAAEL